MNSNHRSWRSDFAALAAELRAAFRAWEERPAPWPESRLTELARRAFRIQWSANRPYRLYCERIGVGPEDPASWREIPAVPTAAFRAVPLCVGPPGEAEAVFRTSGTTRGASARGAHHVRDLDLYRASLEAGVHRQLLGGPGPVRVLSLIPSFSQSADSSLSWMADAVMRRFGAPGSASAAGADGVRWDEAESLAREASDAGQPLCILSTTLAADAWTRRLAAAGTRLALASGSRLMDTGGAKGRPGLERRRVVAEAERWLALPAEAVVNEFGMTELLSQRYSRAVGEPTALEASPLHGPPWLRTRALDPVDLSERPEGELGVLCHLDLANAGSVCAVLTEDLGRVRDNVVEFAGRAAGAPPRGCSLATAELLAAQDDG